MISIPENRKRTMDFGRHIELDLSTPEKEYEHKMFPLNHILDFSKVMLWQNGYHAYYNFDAEKSRLFFEFSTNIVTKIQGYVMPVIWNGII